MNAIETWIELGDKMPERLWNPATNQVVSVASAVDTGERKRLKFGERMTLPRTVMCRRIICTVAE